MTTKLLTEQLRNPRDLDVNLKMEFGPFETIHKWKLLSECNEFVGARYLFQLYLRHEYFFCFLFLTISFTI